MFECTLMYRRNRALSNARLGRYGWMGLRCLEEKTVKMAPGSTSSTIFHLQVPATSILATALESCILFLAISILYSFEHFHIVDIIV